LIFLIILKSLKMKKYFEEKMATYDDYFFTARLNTLDKV